LQLSIPSVLAAHQDVHTPEGFACWHRFPDCPAGWAAGESRCHQEASGSQCPPTHSWLPASPIPRGGNSQKL